MKRAMLCALAALLALSLAAFFVACGGGGDEGGGTADKEYSVTITQPAGAQLSADKQKAKSGETVTVTATVTDAEKYLISVTANGEECEESGGKYTFTVKDKDVTVTAELGTYAEKLTDSFLSWDEKAPSQVIPAAEAPLSPSFGIPFKFSFDEMIFINESKSGIQSSDPSVIPADAFTISYQSINGGNGMGSGTAYLDASKVNPGVTYILLRIQDNTVSTKNATVLKRVEVVEAENFTYEVMVETIELDVSDLKSAGGRYAINLYDADDILVQGIDFGEFNYAVSGINGFLLDSQEDFARYENSSAVWIYFDAADVSDGVITFRFDYIVGHEYRLFAVPVKDDGTADNSRLLAISNQAVSGGSYTEGGVLSFTDTNATLELTVTA